VEIVLAVSMKLAGPLPPHVEIVPAASLQIRPCGLADMSEPKE